MRKPWIFTGGYTEPIQLGSGETVPGRCPGVGAYALRDDGTLIRESCTPSTPNPSFLAGDPSGEYLYCVNELKEYAGMPSSTATAYRIDRATGALTLLNRQLTGGADACYAAVCGKWLLVANYTGGSVCVLPILRDHSLGPASCALRHWGSGVNAQRQSSPHPHQTVLSPDGSWVYVPDLGLDRLICYRFDRTNGYLLPAPERDIALPAGQGARHCAFNAAGTRLYVMTEMACAVDVFAFSPDTGAATLLQTVSALPEHAAPSLGAAIRLHPNGRFLYCTVRGCDVIATFAVAADGLLALKRIQPSGGRIPRDCMLTPDGRYLLVGHQDSDTLCAFSVREEDGALHAVSECAAPCVTTVTVL